MHFLEPPRVMRTPSTEEFVIDEENSDVDNNSRRGSLSNSSQSADFPLPEDEDGVEKTTKVEVECPPKAWEYGRDILVKKRVATRFCIAALCLLCLILASAFTVVLVLYIQTWHTGQTGQTDTHSMINDHSQNPQNIPPGQSQSQTKKTSTARLRFRFRSNSRSRSSNQNASYEVCRSKECTKTATSFLRSMDDTVDPCMDFPKFACGNWLTDTASSVSVGTYDHTTVMRDRVVGRLRVLTENISDSDIEPLRQVKFMYDTCTDTGALEALGVNPLTSLLDQLMEPNVSLAKQIARIKRATGQHYLFDFTLGADYRNTSRNALFIDQPQLTVDSSIFADGGEIGIAYTKLIQESFQHMHEHGYGGLSNIIKNNLELGPTRISSLEQQLSESIADIHSMSKAAMFNLVSLRELNLMFQTELQTALKERQQNSTLSSGTSPNRLQNHLSNFSSSSSSSLGQIPGVVFNWTEYFVELFDGVDGADISDNTQVIVTDMIYVKTLAKILTNVTQEDMDLYLNWQLVYSFGKDVSKEFRNLFYTFSQLQDGSETIPNRHTECLNLLDYNLPYALTYNYVAKFVADEIISEAHEMVENLLKAFKRMVSETEWMDKNTKFRAKLKADRMRAFMGYPNWMKNESAVIHYHQGLTMTNASFFENMLIMQNWLTLKDLRRIGLAVDNSWVSDSPAEADAFYDDEVNAITFPSGFLQEPFFGMGLRSINYGALGAVIGHEITHGFDTRGRYSDEKGRLNSWWSIPTLMQFVRKSQCFVNQYNNYTLPELAESMGNKNHLNGRRTLAENIADNGGVREAFLAYKLYVKETLSGKEEPRLPGLEQYTPEQLFFLSFAQSWCSYMNPASLLETVVNNEHSPSRFRIIGPLTNFDEFSNVWQCPSGSFMNPKNKCVLW